MNEPRDIIGSGRKLKMKEGKKNVTVKGYAGRKHVFEIKKVTLSGYTFYTLYKNGNVVINCDTKEFIKLKNLFA